ncbi:hypothetical protein Lal_00026607 [Lupinus albus]|nr:hypothetical protein Lal_00026607 [Lupinus albus]
MNKPGNFNPNIGAFVLDLIPPKQICILHSILTINHHHITLTINPHHITLILVNKLHNHNYHVIPHTLLFINQPHNHNHILHHIRSMNNILNHGMNILVTMAKRIITTTSPMNQHGQIPSQHHINHQHIITQHPVLTILQLQI